MLANNKGWILIDALIAIIILSIALVALAMAFSNSTVDTAATNNRIAAANLARQLIAQQRTHEGDGTITAAYTLAGAQTDPNSNIPFTFTIQGLPNAGLQLPTGGNNVLEAGVIPVVVTITWSDPKAGGNKTLQTVTYYRQ